MERRDVLILAVGALLVAGATAYAGVQGGDADYVLAYAEMQIRLPNPGFGLIVPTADYKGSASMDLGTQNVTRVHVEWNVTATPAFATGASAHAKLTLPNGTTIEKDASIGPGESTLRLALDAAPCALPAPTTVRASGLDDARAQLPPPCSNGTGHWRIEFSAAPSGVPVASMQVETFEYDSFYVGLAAPLAPDSK